MAAMLHELLETRMGVDEEAFSDALSDFVARAGPLAILEVDPTDYFGESQRAVLGRLGASLKPLDAEDLGPIAGLAAAYGQLVTASLPVGKVATRLRVDPSRVRQRIYSRSLYAFKHRGAWLIPSFQIDNRRVVSGLDVVVPRLSPALHPVAVSRWLTAPHPDLVLGGTPVSPIAWLRAGGPPGPAADLAEAVDQL
jgi:hypothetical protein